MSQSKPNNVSSCQRAIDQIVRLRAAESRPPSAARRHGELAYQMLDMKPGAISASGVTRLHGIRANYVPRVFEAFEAEGLLTVAKAIGTTRKGHRPTVFYNPAPELKRFAADYNHLFAERLHTLVDGSSRMQDFAYRALRGYALLNNIPLETTAPYSQALGSVTETLGRHPQSVIYRSMATCAFAAGVQNELDNAIGLEVRDCEAVA